MDYKIRMEIIMKRTLAMHVEHTKHNIAYMDDNVTSKGFKKFAAVLLALSLLLAVTPTPPHVF